MPLRKDWESVLSLGNIAGVVLTNMSTQVKLDLMHKILFEKFNQNNDIKAVLLSTRMSSLSSLRAIERVLFSLLRRQDNYRSTSTRPVLGCR